MGATVSGLCATHIVDTNRTRSGLYGVESHREGTYTIREGSIERLVCQENTSWHLTGRDSEWRSDALGPSS